MQTQALQIYAGKTALKAIQDKGFTADMFSAFMGASGGPKWFVLSGLDKIMFSEFFAKAEQKIDIIGTSAGAFRSACFAQTNTKAAIERLADKYSTTIYSEKPSAREITQKSRDLLNHVLDEASTHQLLSNNKRAVHIIASRCHGLMKSENRIVQLAGLGLANLRNLRSRKTLAKSFTRSVFYSGDIPLNFDEKPHISTEYIKLSNKNVHDALVASGSIPIIIEGISDIAGASKGVFRDGGILDYHFDMKINTERLVLYPHFFKTPIPGWFDKRLKHRICRQDNYDNVVLLAPSDEFVASLPYGKISDRKDFTRMPPAQRIPYWQQVIQESERLAESFFAQIESENIANFVQAIDLKR